MCQYILVYVHLINTSSSRSLIHPQRRSLSVSHKLCWKRYMRSGDETTMCVHCIPVSQSRYGQCAAECALNSYSSYFNAQQTITKLNCTHETMQKELKASLCSAGRPTQAAMLTISNHLLQYDKYILVQFTCMWVFMETMFCKPHKRPQTMFCKPHKLHQSKPDTLPQSICVASNPTRTRNDVMCIILEDTGIVWQYLSITDPVSTASLICSSTHSASSRKGYTRLSLSTIEQRWYFLALSFSPPIQSAWLVQSHDTFYENPSYKYSVAVRTNLWAMLDKVLQSSLQLSDSFN